MPSRKLRPCWLDDMKITILPSKHTNTYSCNIKEAGNAKIWSMSREYVSEKQARTKFLQKYAKEKNVSLAQVHRWIDSKQIEVVIF